MECRPAAFLALLTLLASGEGAGAEVPDPAPPDVKAETLRLIQADFQRVTQAVPQGGAPAAVPTRTDSDVIKLSPFIVTDKEIPAVIFPHYETRLHRFLREGTFYQKGGWVLQATFLPTQRPIGSTAKPGARFELSASLRF